MLGWPCAQELAAQTAELTAASDTVSRLTQQLLSSPSRVHGPAWAQGLPDGDSPGDHDGPCKSEPGKACQLLHLHAPVHLHEINTMPK